MGRMKTYELSYLAYLRLRCSYRQYQGKSLEALQALIALAPLTEKDFSDWFKENEIENPTLEDYYEYDDNDGCHLAAIMSMVIMETEGVYLTACNNIREEDFLLYEPLYPWGLTEIDKTMTKEKLETIFCKYFSMITDDVIDLDYQEAENGG